ncbi:hypothetical protein SPBR_03378 [Sporothrix brasiliensis 5110]|uniref:Uncharacterized protein n=1 Tax=Sporothrix brasiliensis 5110 TaxID=1398154 RepID=A0A0C2F1Q8_9PEZI|nr:uncharacterized protein SPBR_03378 [Sporothrix brasiliensis 5110]KIH92864.1 hypothetical protein SPBR_03378 [Sporothrix brasiliensis 5110]
MFCIGGRHTRRRLAINTELAAFDNETTRRRRPRSAQYLALQSTVDKMLCRVGREQPGLLLCDNYPAVTRTYPDIDDTVGREIIGRP